MLQPDTLQTPNTEWLNFLKTENLALDHAGKMISVNSIDNQMQDQTQQPHFLTRHESVLTSLTHQSLIKVSGSDAVSFLQGQLTTDVHQVSKTQAQPSAYCDPQGQVLAFFLIFKIQDDLYLSFDGSLKETILKRLTMFVMRSDVKLTDVSNQLIHIGFAGELFGLNPTLTKPYEIGVMGVKGNDTKEVCVIKVPGPYPKYDLFGSVDQIIQAWNTLKTHAHVTNAYDWSLLNITAGIPEITQKTSAQFLAQFLNLDQLNAIDFKKGCFPGQEMIARVHYRGKVTKRIFCIRCEATLELTEGEALTLSDRGGKNYKLTIINLNSGTLKGTLCLAVGTLKSLDAVEGDLFTESGQQAFIEPLPYTLLNPKF